MIDKLLILSPETEEEKNDMQLIASNLDIAYVTYRRFFDLKFRYLSKILDCVLFFIFIFKHRNYQDISILGAPCLRNRIASVLFGKKYILYLRCLHSNGENATYLSDKIDFFCKRLGINSRLTNPYMADSHLVTSVQTRHFLNVRKAGNNIINIGAIWLKNKKLRNKSENNIRKVYFISQAFAEHGFLEAQLEQIEFVNKLRKFLNERCLDLVIKKHPRDYYSYEEHSLFDGNAESFLNSISEDDIIVSFFSTLGFEISLLGGNVKFVSLPSLEKIYNPLYKQNDVDFYTDFGADFSFLFDDKLKYVIFSQPKSINMDEIFK